MAVTPNEIMDYFATELQTLLPNCVVRKSFGVPFGTPADSDLLRQRYGKTINGKSLMRGWWIEWSNASSTKQMRHFKSDEQWSWTFNGIYQISEKESDEMIATAYDDVFAIMERWRPDPVFEVNSTHITVLMPDDESGAQYESNTQTGIELAGVNVYMPVLSMRTKHRRG